MRIQREGGGRQLPFGPDGVAVVDDSVGGSDPTDIYHFTLDQQGQVQIGVQGAQGDVDLMVYNAYGSCIGASANGGLEFDGLEGELSPGTYYVEVRPSEGAATPYHLEVQATGNAPGPVSPSPVPGPVAMPPVARPAPGVPAASAAALPESLALRDHVGLAAASGGSEKFAERRNPLLSEQMLAVG